MAFFVVAFWVRMHAGPGDVFSFLSPKNSKQIVAAVYVGLWLATCGGILGAVAALVPRKVAVIELLFGIRSRRFAFWRDVRREDHNFVARGYKVRPQEPVADPPFTFEIPIGFILGGARALTAEIAARTGKTALADGPR